MSDIKKIYCQECDADITGKTRYYYDGEVHCASCFADWVEEYAKSNPEDVARLMNVDFVEVNHEYL